MTTKDEVMYKALVQKFTQNQDLGQMLISTGNSIIVETTSADKYWASAEGGNWNPFTVRVLTDHRPLQWVQNVDTASGRVTRWMLELASYDMRIEFIPGRVNDVADALSRLMDSSLLNRLPVYLTASLLHINPASSH